MMVCLFTGGVAMIRVAMETSKPVSRLVEVWIVYLFPSSLDHWRVQPAPPGL